VVALRYAAAFVALVLFLFLASDRRIVIYDEGILLTNAMRVLAGQVIHRDFYYNYGPARIYILAGLFRVFGPSVLAERLLGLCGDALLVITLYAITKRVARQKVALVAGALGLVWVFGIGLWSLLTAIILWAAWLVVRTFESDLSRGRAFAAGTLVGAATLVRYDMGLGVAACLLLVIAIAVGLRAEGARSGAISFARNLWAYLVGIAAVLVLPVWAYLRVARVHDVMFDVVLYTARHYRQARGLPFPRPHIAQLQDMVVYVLIVLIAASLYVAVRSIQHRRRSERAEGALPVWIGPLIAFGVVAVMMYLKGMVRIGPGEEGMAAMTCIVMAAVLYQHKEELGVGLRRVALAMIFLLCLTTVWGALHQLSAEHKFKTSMLLWALEPGKQQPQPPFNNWCRDESPVVHGVCYVIDDDHIQTVEFLEAHTRPGDRLYVGLPQHDRILINDNLTYFATQRLPATKWSHFDPFLQNSAPIQREMIGDLQRNKPPYVVLDSEFDALHEPNGSSVHTGVHLLDNYIAQHYEWVKTFGEMTVLQRRPGLAANQSKD
jgi:hypothetical protein